MKDTKEALSQADFDVFRRYIESHTGIYLDDNKRKSLQISLEARMNALDIPTYSAYYAHITDGLQGKREFDELLNLIVIKETFFFRDERQLQVLIKNILPELIVRKKGKEIKIWSAGCATGEEPYSLAISMLENFSPANVNVSIYATDINPNTIKQAKDGIYTKSSMRAMDKAMTSKYFIQKNGRYYLHDAVKRLVKFDTVNLIEPYSFAGSGGFDVIFCKNVIIYFRLETMRNIIHGFYELLKDGGCLFIGHSESLWQISNEFTLEEISGVFFYRKTGNTKPFSLPHDVRQAEKGITAYTPSQGTAPPFRKRALPGLSLPAKTMKEKAPLPHVKQKPAAPNRSSFHSSARQKATSEIPGAKDPRGIQGLFAPPGNGNYEELLECLQKALETDPGNVDTHLLMGKVYANLGLYDKALRKGLDALEIHDLCAETYVFMGSVYYKTGDKEKAVASFKKAIFLDDKSILSHYYLGNIYKDSNLAGQAIKEYKNVIRITETNPEDAKCLVGEVFTVRQLKEICVRNIELLTAKPHQW